MLSEIERQMCRDYKARLDAQQTPAGKAALKMANAKKKEQERMENILKFYKDQPLPAESKPKEPENPILRMYMHK